MQGFGQNLGLERIVFIRKHAHMAGQIAVDLHEPQCREAVEPCIRHLFHNLLVALFIDLCDQCPALLHLFCRQHFAVDAISTGVHHFRFRNAVLLGFLRHAGNQFFPRPDRIFLDGVFIHGSHYSLTKTIHLQLHFPVFRPYHAIYQHYF